MNLQNVRKGGNATGWVPTCENLSRPLGCSFGKLDFKRIGGDYGLVLMNFQVVLVLTSTCKTSEEPPCGEPFVQFDEFAAALLPRNENYMIPWQIFISSKTACKS